MTAIKVLDHGYVAHVESWGSDARIIEAARMSTDKGFQGWGGAPCPECNAAVRIDSEGLFLTMMAMEQAKSCPTCKGGGKTVGDEKLLRYLYEHRHHTPFEMAGLILEVQAPIFVFREWHRHRTQSYNELSARYTALPDLFYVPSMQRLQRGKQSTANKQSTTEGLTAAQAMVAQQKIINLQARARGVYEALLAEGVGRELARLVIPVSQYSRMRASANLRNWLAFLTLRMATDAQWEIRQFAGAVGDIVKQEFPRTWELFEEGMR